MDSNTTGKSSSQKFYIKGILYSNAFALVAFYLAYYVSNWSIDAGGVLIISEFVLVPIAMGIIAMKQWINVTKRILSLIPMIFLNTIIALLLSAIFMGEGIICLIVVSPLILVFMWAGVFTGKNLYKDHNRTLKTSTFMIFILLFLYDTFSVHDYHAMVSDTITIKAPREVVWKYVGEYPLNTSEPDYWLFKVGLPNPVQSTVTGDSVGACRKCIFSNHATFDEVVTEYKTNEVYTFDITKQPDDPEIIGHIEIERGQFVLKENPDGTTTLTGNSWYRLNVYPVWYFDWWAEDITRNVHIRVMKHIKELAEKDV